MTMMMRQAFPLDILVGANSIAGVPQYPQLAWPGWPGGAFMPTPENPPGIVAQPPGAYGPPVAYNPGCSPNPPCTPSPFIQRCYEQAMRAAVAAKTPQIPISFRSTAVIPAGTVSTLALLPAITPDVPMCITHFEIPRSVGAQFLVNSLTTSRINLLANGNGVHAESFAPDAVNRPPIQNPLVMPGQQIVLFVENLGADAFFFGTLWGIPGNNQPFCLG